MSRRLELVKAKVGKAPETLLGSQEVDARRHIRYNGSSSKKRVLTNVNYYDHNILGLDNRAKSGQTQETVMNRGMDNILYSSVDNRRSHSVCGTRGEIQVKMNQRQGVETWGKKKADMTHYTEIDPPKIINAHLHSEIRLDHMPDVSIENYRKNTGILDAFSTTTQRPRTATGIYATSRTRGKDPLIQVTLEERFKDIYENSTPIKNMQTDIHNSEQGHANQILSPPEESSTLEDSIPISEELLPVQETPKKNHEKCPSCYNKVASEKKREIAIKERTEKLAQRIEDDKKYFDREQGIKEKERLLQQVKNQIEKEAMNQSLNCTTQKRKQEALYNPRFGQNSYPYEKLGRDHKKIVEAHKEEERERKREIISKQLSDISMKQKLLAKERQSQCKTSIDLPSFTTKPSNKLQYKKFLLQQMELDKEKRKLEKEFGKLQISESPVVEKSSRRPKPAAAQVPVEKPSEKRIQMEKTLERVYIDKSVKDYNTSIQEAVEKQKESAIKLAEVLEKQINDRNEKKRRDRSLHRNWKTASASHTARPVERKRKINETSENNAMIDLVSPGIHSLSPSKR